MDDAPKWPPYYSGPKDSTFALGVIGSSYGKFEFAVSAMFATVTGTSSTFASILLPRITNETRIALMEQALPLMEFPEPILEHVSHFIAGYSSIVHNRNMLMHSQVFPGGLGMSILIKTQRNGKTVGCGVTLTQLMQIADDMHAFYGYGIALSNCINLPKLAELMGATEPPPRELSTLPNKPALPNRLEYTSDPIPHH